MYIPDTEAPRRFTAVRWSLGFPEEVVKCAETRSFLDSMDLPSGIASPRRPNGHVRT